MPVALVVRVLDTQANQHFEMTFERSPVRIGRNQLNELPIDRPYISQFHAAIEIHDRQIFIRDLGSTNGVVFAGQRIPRDQPVEVTGSPEFHIGPIVLRIARASQTAKKPGALREGAVLDLNEAGEGSAAYLSRTNPIPPGGEDPFIRHILPYIEAYRTAWTGVYRVIYDQLPRMSPELRVNYLKRLGLEHPAVNAEPDFQKIAQYYRVDSRTLGELTPPLAALAALNELSATLVPGAKPLDDVPSILTFARRLRDTIEVFLKCFIPLRDGYRAFEADVLARDRDSFEGDRVTVAKDPKELGAALLGPNGKADAVRQLNEIFIEVMSHQVALLNGVMEGVKTLLGNLSPGALEEAFEKKGKKTGLFENKYEALWRLYEERHGDYSGEDKQIFLTIFGRQFFDAYTASVDEDYKTSDAARKNARFPPHPTPVTPPPIKR